jgi:RNA polymerase sigma factor (sigma-70 family)
MSATARPLSRPGPQHASAATESARPTLAEVYSAARGLRPERAEVLVLHACGGLTAPEIAETLGVNENTVRSRLQRGRRDAREIIRRRKLAASPKRRP